MMDYQQFVTKRQTLEKIVVVCPMGEIARAVSEQLQNDGFDVHMISIEDTTVTYMAQREVKQ